MRAQFGREKDDAHVVRSWNLSEELLPQAVEVALENDRWPRQKMGPIELHFSYNFTWARLGTSDALPGQDWSFAPQSPRGSMLGIVIGARPLFLQPAFLLPYTWQSDELREYLGALEEALGFKFRDGWFQHIIAAKQPGRLRYRRVSVPR